MALLRLLTGLLVALLLGGAPSPAIGVEHDVDGETADAFAEEPEPAPSPTLEDEVAALREDIGSLWLQMDGLTEGDAAPPWATQGQERLDRRLERVTTLLERLAARVETPVPRLDEPLTLLTVSLCTFVLGFVAGRSLRRRSSRKDARFGL